MKALIKISVMSLSAFLILSVLAVSLYDVIMFEPRRHEIDQLLGSASGEDLRPPEVIKKLIALSSGPNVPDYAVARHFVPATSGSHLSWSLDMTLWVLLLKLHYTFDDRLALLCSLSYTGQGIYGLNNAALNRFGKPLSKLSVEESASIVLLLKSPTRPVEENSSRVEQLLARLKANQ